MDIEDVFRTHQREVFAYFLRLVPHRQDAEELTQETFLRACGAALRFRGDSSVRTWIFGIGGGTFYAMIGAVSFFAVPLAGITARVISKGRPRALR